MKLPFSRRTAQRLMAIAAHPVLTTHVSQLPPSWGTLYQLAQLPNEVLLAGLEDGAINPDTERKDGAALLGRPRKPAATPKPDLLIAWAAAPPMVRRVLFERIGVREILDLISNNARAELAELLERHRTATGGSCNSFALNLTQLIRVALSSNNINERDNALAGINRKLKAAGRDLHDITIAMVKPRKAKR